jgi:hypothetical protein
MAGSKSKEKGKSFEREVSGFLSNLYGESFVRVPNSGAFIGGANQQRKAFLSEHQSKSFKGDIIPPDSWTNFNAEAKSYADFPFHLVLTGDCKVLDGWLDQMMQVAEDDDLNILFMKFNRKGKFVCVQTCLTWVTDQFLYYTSKNHQDWIIIEWNHFFKLNKDLLKGYCSGIKDIKSTNFIDINTLVDNNN